MIKFIIFHFHTMDKFGIQYACTCDHVVTGALFPFHFPSFKQEVAELDMLQLHTFSIFREVKAWQ